MQPDQRLTAHFHLSELTRSETAARAGLRNEADSVQLKNLKRLAHQGEDVRDFLENLPIIVGSGLRTWVVNALVKNIITVGQLPLLAAQPELVRLCQADRSAHVEGRAMDFTAPRFGTPRAIVARLRATSLPFDQLIFEGTWVHLGIAREGEEPRREVLTALFEQGRKPRYVKGLM